MEVCVRDFTFEHVGDAQSERFVNGSLRSFEGILRRGGGGGDEFECTSSPCKVVTKWNLQWQITTATLWDLGNYKRFWSHLNLVFINTFFF